MPSRKELYKAPQDFISKALAIFRRRGLRPRPDPRCGVPVRVYEGNRIQHRTWRNFLFIGPGGVEVARYSGSGLIRFDRTFLTYSQIGQVQWIGDEPSDVWDMLILDRNGCEIARLNDTFPDAEEAQQLIESNIN